MVPTSNVVATRAMADFRTHVMGAAVVSGLAATAVAMIHAGSDGQVLGYFVLGVVGGMLPDIDSDGSIPIRVAFNVLSVVTGFVVVFHFASLSLVELVLLGGGAFALVRFGVFDVFTRLTVHRGLIHSIPAAAVGGLLSVLLGRRVFALTPMAAWTAGSFVALGFLVHLALDELYSVDLMGGRLKHSFGTALSLGSGSDPLGTATLYFAVVVLYLWCPPVTGFWHAVTDPASYRLLSGRLWPHHGWFDGVLNGLVASWR